MPYKCPEKAREASKISQRKYRKKNKEKLNIITLGRYHKLYKKDEDYLEYRREYQRKYRAENKEKLKSYHTTEEQREKARKRALEYQRNNPGKMRARSAFRKKKVKAATPPWVNKEGITQLYEQAVELEKLTGQKYHVDHIVPITHERVCGLHILSNLRIILASDNLKKGNNFP